ncbi:MAG: aminomethyl-transferring glycine dehydrogenase subunit GcvPA [Deltaproteobacteria bacterium]|jgi:glycine dehydrogenase subunit 1|nr:aminomethyl-transferring glycine dehydrogenase subunit GcvPA [Deltaproteobacteria bacterium]
MRYLPHTAEDVKEMLAAVGVKSIDGLFECVPPEARRERPLDLPAPLTEWELRDKIEGLAQGGDWQVFTGAGSYAHRIPALVPYLASRSEFLTSYTPYQPEMSQGTLQAIFEFQTLISRLTGLAVTNASMYDGATAFTEAALMAQRCSKKRALAVSELAHPHWRQVLETYLAAIGDVELLVLPADAQGRTDYGPLAKLDKPAALLVQSPNFLGVIEDLPAAAEAIHKLGGLLVVGFAEAFALGLTKSPGSQGADIVVGDGQSLGLGQGFGGPSVGLMSSKQEFVRQIPGRLVGKTEDAQGRRGFVLTLSTREQHIRRSKAVSNICSNAGHCALTAAMFMASTGGTGFRKLAQVNLDLSEYLKKGLLGLGFKPLGDAPTFNEFALTAPKGFDQKREDLLGKKILAGLPLGAWYPKYEGVYLFGATETKTRADIDAFLAEVSE